MTFEDEEAQKAIRDAIASDKSGAALAQANGMDFTGNEIDMEPESIDGKLAADPMDQTLALADAPPPMQWRTVEEAPPPTPQGGLAAMPSAQMAMPGDSDVTMRERVASQDDGGGFDWSRAFFAAGGGDLSAFDANRARRQEAPYKRAAALQEQMDRDQARSLARAAMDPMSQESRARQAEYANEMNARAQMMSASGMNDLAATFAEEAKRAGTMSASQIDRSQFGKVFGDALKFSDIQAKREALPAKQAMEERKVAAAELQARNTGAQGWERLAQSKEENALKREEHAIVRDEKKQAREEARQEKLPAGEQVSKYNQRKVAVNEIDKALNLLDKVTYTGVGAETANNIMAKDPTGLLDKRSDADRQFVSYINSLRAKARNQIFGAALSKYDIADAESFLASLGSNKATIRANLERLKAAANDENTMEEGYYPGLTRPVTKQSKPATPASTADAAMVDRARKAAAGGNAKAAQWLKDNGYAQ